MILETLEIATLGVAALTGYAFGRFHRTVVIRNLRQRAKAHEQRADNALADLQAIDDALRLAAMKRSAAVTKGNHTRRLMRARREAEAHCRMASFGGDDVA